MKIARRILITVVCTVAFLGLVARFIVPVAFSFYEAREALPIAKIVPVALPDQSISQHSGSSLSYLGYEFDVPWDDLDTEKTALYPKDKPLKTTALLAFHSGLKVKVSTFPAHLMATGLADGTLLGTKWSTRQIEAIFGAGSQASDYTLVNNLFEFTPERMHVWSTSNQLHARETMLLLFKSMYPVGPAQTGIFRVQNENCKGFQQGDPGKHPKWLVVTLYCGEGHVEFVADQSNYKSALNQPEINRIIQSLRHSTPDETKTASR